MTKKVIIVGKNDKARRFYTSKTGPNGLSENQKDAYQYHSEVHAERECERLNNVGVMGHAHLKFEVVPAAVSYAPKPLLVTMDLECARMPDGIDYAGNIYDFKTTEQGRVFDKVWIDEASTIPVSPPQFLGRVIRKVREPDPATTAEPVIELSRTDIRDQHARHLAIMQTLSREGRRQVLSNMNHSYGKTGGHLTLAQSLESVGVKLNPNIPGLEPTLAKSFTVVRYRENGLTERAHVVIHDPETGEDVRLHCAESCYVSMLADALVTVGLTQNDEEIVDV